MDDNTCILELRDAAGDAIPGHPDTVCTPPTFGDAEYLARRTLDETPAAASVRVVDATSGQWLVELERE